MYQVYFSAIHLSPHEKERIVDKTFFAQHLDADSIQTSSENSEHDYFFSDIC